MLEKFKVQTKTIEVYDTCLTAESLIVKDNLKIYFDKFYNTPVFKNILYESDIFEVPSIGDVKLFSIEFFNNITEIINTYSSLGSHNAIISLWKAILGDDTIVEFVYRDNDGVFTNEVNITSQSTITGDIIDNDNNLLITEDLAIMQWINNRTGLNASELINLINYYIPAGVVIKWNFLLPQPIIQVLKNKYKQKKNKTTNGVI